jgi:hypothetical protein
VKKQSDKKDRKGCGLSGVDSKTTRNSECIGEKVSFVRKGVEMGRKKYEI